MGEDMASAVGNEPNWHELAKAMAVAIMFQRGTRGVHVIGRDGRVRMGQVDLFGCYAVDEMAKRFCDIAGIEFTSIAPPTEHEAMFMALAGMTWMDWLERSASIRLEARGPEKKEKVDMRALALAIEARRAPAATGSRAEMEGE